MIKTTCSANQSNIIVMIAASLFWGLILLPAKPSVAQTPEQAAALAQAQAAAAQAGVALPAGAVPAGATPAVGPDGQPIDSAQAASTEEQAEPKVIRRDAISDDAEADQTELKATVDKDGKVSFQFRNQPWVDLIEWLAEISEQPLDWQELPGDRVNLASTKRYTVVETRDLFNRHLLARGYTLLELDGGITVVKTENINPGMVKRVDADQLATLPRHTFVRTLLDVGWLSAEKLAEELKPMISANGRLTALTTTNRIEAMDAAINLRQISDLLQQERNGSSRNALAPEFVLVHIPAEEAKRLLEDFLGIEKKSNAPLTPQQMQMQQMLRQQNRGQPAAPKKDTQVSIVANTRRNSILVRASRDQIAIASQFILQIDVPSKSMGSLEEIKSRVEAFRLVSLDPEKLIEIVSEMNVLEPTTRIRVDADNSAIVVSGSKIDRFIIKQLIDQLDGSGREFEVLQLRRLNATEVTESITFLMGKDEEDDQSNGRIYYYSYGNEEENKDTDEFRVAANTRYNQVLLWANESEMEEVRSLLVKLGELPPPGGNQQKFRVIEAASTKDTYEYLLRLKAQFQQMSPGSSLELPDISQFSDPEVSTEETDTETKGDESTEEKQENEPAEDTDETETDSINKSNLTTRLSFNGDQLTAIPVAQVQESQDEIQAEVTKVDLNDDNEGEAIDAESITSMEEFDRRFRQQIRERTQELEQPEQATTGPGSGIRISLDAEGNLVLNSDDTEALDRLEDLMLQYQPPQQNYVVFHLKHARATWIVSDLEDYFEEEGDDDESDRDVYYRYILGLSSGSSNDNSIGLSGANKLKFVYNIETNTIVVSGASPSQLRTVRELITLWDHPDPIDKRQARHTQLVVIQFGQATKIANTLKEAYRDLLSGNDKAFSQNNQGGDRSGGNNREGNNGNQNQGGGMVNANGGQQSGGADLSFKGKLSFGVDDVGNTLLVSAEGESLLQLMVDMIKQLDEAAKPQGAVHVLHYSPGIDGESLRSALSGLSSESSNASNRPVQSQQERSDQGNKQ